LGKIKKQFKTLPVLMRLKKDKDGKQAVEIRMWFANRKNRSVVKTLASLMDNMCTGVTAGYKYIMKYGHKRHPMKPASSKDGKSIKIANYLGQQETNSINAPAGVNIECDPENPLKEIFITGIDNESVGTCAALIHQSCRPRNLDRRKFEDGLYIQVRGLQQE
jgi:large subunit ribosomal protein L9e